MLRIKQYIRKGASFFRIVAMHHGIFDFKMSITVLLKVHYRIYQGHNAGDNLTYTHFTLDNIMANSLYIGHQIVDRE